VIGGFLAGSGWLLARGAMRVMTGRSLSFEALPGFLQGEVLAQWLPGVAFGILLFVALKRLRHPYTLPLLLFGAIALFWLGLEFSGMSVNDARRHGWLADLPLGHSFGSFSAFFIINLAPWHLLAQEWSILATILLTSVVSILLTASALELA